MRIGIVVPKEIMTDIHGFIKKEFPDIESVTFPYQSIMDIPGILSGHQNKADALLFLGETARRYAEKALPPTSEWLTIPRSTASLLRLLFRAAVSGYGMHIATDWGNEDLFRLAFQEVGLTSRQASVYTLPFFPYTESLLVKDANEMEMLYRNGKVDLCITIFYQVRDMLKARGVPVYILQPSFDDIRSALQRLVLAHELQLSQNSQIAVISIRTDIPSARFPESSGYDLALEQLSVTRHIYQFARAIQAACIEQPPSGYLLFGTRTLLENATDHFHHLPLLENVAEETAFTLSIGFGYGATADEAKLHAQRAMEHASADGGNTAYLIGKELATPVPMSRNDQSAQKKTDRPIADEFLSLSQKTGISIRILSRLYQSCRDTGRQRFTSAELADLTGVTPRTMNRILLKLIDHHLAQEVGRKYPRQTGRPSRVIELLIKSQL